MTTDVRDMTQQELEHAAFMARRETAVIESALMDRAEALEMLKRLRGWARRASRSFPYSSRIVDFSKAIDALVDPFTGQWLEESSDG